MSYPILAASDTWFTQGGTTIKRTSITQINIVDSYTPTGTETASWDASAAKDNSIMAYVNGTTLIIAGNGSGGIYANPDSSFAFTSSTSPDSSGFHNVTAITGMNLLDTSNVTSMMGMLYSCQKLTEVDVSNWNTGKVTNMYGIFGNCYALTSLDVSKWNTSKVTTMFGAFCNCKALKTLDVSGWDTSEVTLMTAMFQYAALTELDISNWNTSKVTSMAFMLYGATGIGTIDLSNLDVSKVTSFDHMFAHSNLIVNGISNWDTSSATNMYAMFHTVKNTTIDVSNFDTSKVIAFGQMFEYMSNLKEIKGLENFDTSKGIDFDEMFNGCTSLMKLDLSSFDTRNATFNNTQISWNGSTPLSTWHMFENCRNLKEIKLGENFTFSGDGTTKTNYTYGTLPTPSSTYITGADGNWYTANRVAYTPASIPNNIAMTYYASLDIVNDIDYLIKNGTLLDIADAIRTSSDITDTMTPLEIPASIPKVYKAGQSSMVDESKIIEKTVSGAFISADDVSEIPHKVGCKVSGIDDLTSVKVTRCGKNLFDVSQVKSTSGNVTNNGDGTLTVSQYGNATRTTVREACPSLKVGDICTLTFTTTGFSSIYLYGANISCSNGKNLTITDDILNSYLTFYCKRVDGVNYEAIVSNIQLELGSTATDYEPYTSTEYTPNADGTVEGITSLSPYMNVFTDNANVNISMTYRKSWGMQSEYDRFWNEIWDGIQLGGKRKTYTGFFAYEYWNEKTFRPKYDMRLTYNNSSMFDRFGGTASTTTKSIDLAQILEDCGVVLDTSQSTYLNNLFYFSSVSRVPEISAVGCTSTLIGVFALCAELETVDKFILKEDGSDKLKDVFLKDISLRNIIIEGTMGDSVSFEWCPLSKESILSVFNALSSTATGLTLTLKLSAVNTAFETSKGAADGSTSEEWNTLIATKPNWTISLV